LVEIQGKWVKYNKNYFYLFIPFYFDQPTGQTRGWIFTHDSSKRREIRQGCAFWGSEQCAAKFWGITRKKMKFWGREYGFQA